MGILGGDEPQIIPPVEILFTKDKTFYSTAIKSQDLVETRVPTEIEPELYARIEKEVLDAFRVLGCRDYSRIDVRVDDEGVPYVIDVNTLPGMEPLYSDYPKACKVMGLEYHQLVDHLLKCALKRRKN